MKIKIIYSNVKTIAAITDEFYGLEQACLIHLKIQMLYYIKTMSEENQNRVREQILNARSSNEIIDVLRGELAGYVGVYGREATRACNL